jgi:hypothetical protein
MKKGTRRSILRAPSSVTEADHALELASPTVNLVRTRMSGTETVVAAAEKARRNKTRRFTTEV